MCAGDGPQVPGMTIDLGGMTEIPQGLGTIIQQALNGAMGGAMGGPSAPPPPASDSAGKGDEQ